MTTGSTFVTFISAVIGEMIETGGPAKRKKERGRGKVDKNKRLEQLHTTERGERDREREAKTETQSRRS